MKNGTWQVRARLDQMIRHPFYQGQGVMVVIARHHGPGQQADIFRLDQFCPNPGGPVHGGLAIDLLAIAQQGAAEFGPFIG